MCGEMMIGYRNRSSFDMALLKGAILEIEMPPREVLFKIAYFGGVIYPPREWPPMDFAKGGLVKSDKVYLVGQ